MVLQCACSGAYSRPFRRRFAGAGGGLPARGEPGAFRRLGVLVMMVMLYTWPLDPLSSSNTYNGVGQPYTCWVAYFTSAPCLDIQLPGSWQGAEVEYATQHV